LFDVHGVLYRYERSARIAALAAMSGRSPDHIRAVIWDSGFETAGDAGALDAAAYLRGFGARLDYDLSEAEWAAAHQVAVMPVEATLALLSRVPRAASVALLTNNNLLVRRHFSTLYPYVAAMVGAQAYVSAEFGACKPDPAVYQRCLARLGWTADATLFVDDSASNIAGARAAGLHAYQYVGPDALSAELCRLQLLV
jgi:glucose-1-phosphatase